jgi:hypothetical protein
LPLLLDGVALLFPYAHALRFVDAPAAVRQRCVPFLV